MSTFFGNLIFLPPPVTIFRALCIRCKLGVHTCDYFILLIVLSLSPSPAHSLLSLKVCRCNGIPVDLAKYRSIRCRTFLPLEQSSMYFFSCYENSHQKFSLNHSSRKFMDAKSNPKRKNKHHSSSRI